MSAPCVVVPPSPNWYGAHLAAEHPREPLVAYAGHDAAVIVRCGASGASGGGESGGGDNTNPTPPSIERCLAPHPARVTSVAFAPAPEAEAGEDDEDERGENGASGSSSNGGADNASTTTTAPPLLVVCGCEDGTAVCWDARRGIRTRAARRYRSALSAIVAVTMVVRGGGGGGGSGGGDGDATTTPPPKRSFAVFGDSSGRLLAWSYGTGERSKPAPLAAKLLDHGGVVCLAVAAAPSVDAGAPPLLLFAGCRDGTVACVELRPHEGEEDEAPCSSSVRFVFSPYECGGGGGGGGGRPKAGTTAVAAAAQQQQRGQRKTPASSASSSTSAMPPEAVQALECLASADGRLLLLTGTAAGGLALWDESLLSASATASSRPRPLARASLPRPPTQGPGGGGGGGGQAPWTAARVVPGSLRHDADGESCVVAAGAPGGALVLLPLRWRSAVATAPPPAVPPLARTRAAHSRPVFAVCFPGGGEHGSVLATISMDRCLVLSRVLGVGAAGDGGGGPHVPPPPPPSSPASSSSSAATTTASIQPFWRSQGLGGYAYAMDARSGALAIACGDRTLRLLVVKRRRGGEEAAAAMATPTAAAIGEPELVWSGATSKLLCCAWRPQDPSLERRPKKPLLLLAWGDADGRVGTLGGTGVDGGAGSAGAMRFEPFPHARHGGPALQLSWSPGDNPSLYSLGGEGCLLRWPAPTEAVAASGGGGASRGPAAAAAAAAAAVAAVVGPGPPVDVSPLLHAAFSASQQQLSPPARPRQWTAAAWHPHLPLLAVAADDGAVAVFSPLFSSGGRERGGQQNGHQAEDEEEDDDQQQQQQQQQQPGGGPRWRVVGFCARPSAVRRGRVRRLAWAPPSRGPERQSSTPLLLAAVHARDLAVFAVDPTGEVAVEMQAHVVRASAAAATATAEGGQQDGGPGAGTGDEAMDAAWLPAEGAAGGDPDPLLVVGLGNGRLRAWRVRTGEADEGLSSSSPSSPPPPRLFLVPTAAAAAGAAGLPAHADAVQSLAPLEAPAGEQDQDAEPLLLSGSRDQSVRVWRARDFGPLAGAGDVAAAAAAAAAVGVEAQGADGAAEQAPPAAPPHAAAAPAAAPGPAVSQRHWRRLLPAGSKQAMPEPPPARTPQERAACLGAVLALARAVLPLPGEEEEGEATTSGGVGGNDNPQYARLLALMVADADAVAADPELRRDMSAERRAALAAWRGDVRAALSAAGGGGATTTGGGAAASAAPPPIGADGAVVAAAAGGAAWRAASAALAVAADASGQPCTAAVHRRAAGLLLVGEEEEEEGRGGGEGSEGGDERRKETHLRL